ncbi:MAG: hypothetical protein F4X92_11070 [Gammaproteobacteria bacterium]|nr:hypothetical protein [Gammaproteobacteria bacterium]
MEAVRQHSTPKKPWVAVNIKPGNLKSSVEVVMLIVDAVNTESERLSSHAISGIGGQKLNNLLGLGRKLYQELSERGVGIAGFSLGGKSESETDTAELSQRVFQNASRLLENFHVVVFVDEAQNTPIGSATKDVLDCLHDPPADIPLVTVFLGLGDTEGILTDCGLSGPADERVVNLGVLSNEEASDAIRGVFHAYCFTGSLKDQNMWVERLAELSQGWPQHINRVAVAAARVIRDHGGGIKAEFIQKALEDGQRRKENYYASRLAACSHEPSLYRQIALAVHEAPDGVLSRSSLRSMVQPLLEDPQMTFDGFLKNALHTGVLAETRKIPKHYQIPIPSFRDYLQALPV